MANRVAAELRTLAKEYEASGNWAMVPPATLLRWADGLEGTEPLTDEEMGALGAALHAGVVEGQITEEQHDRLLGWAKLRARLAREDGG